MPRKLSCEDIGFACDKVWEAASDAELLDQVRQHLALEHPDEPLDDDERLRTLIRDG